MATSFGELKERVARDLEPHLSRLHGDEIGRAIIDAVEYYSDEPLWFLDEIQALSTVAGTDNYALPTNLLSLDVATLTSDGDEFPLEPVDFQKYRWLQVDTSDLSGEPYRYSLYDNSIWLYPTPDAVYTYTLYYRKRLVELTADTDESDWITYGWRLLKWHALSDLGTSPLDLPDFTVTRWAALAERELQKLRSKSVGRMVLPTGRPRDF